MRPPYPDSVRILKARIDIIGDELTEVTRNPRHDDEVLGPSIFRMRVEDVALDDLTLPGLYVGRTELIRCSFRDADLHLSSINWSDLEDCSFEAADLTGADLRGCRFVRCRFDRAVLAEADLRGSSFEGCTFGAAVFSGTRLFRRHRLLGLVWPGRDQDSLPLSAQQRSEAVWSADLPKPGGG